MNLEVVIACCLPVVLFGSAFIVIRNDRKKKNGRNKL